MVTHGSQRLNWEAVIRCLLSQCSHHSFLIIIVRTNTFNECYGILDNIFIDESFFVLCLGAIGILWAIMWLMLTHDRPEDHPRISAKEKEYIQSSIGSGDDAHARVGLKTFLCILICSMLCTKSVQ